jgi:site-specific recombinase XerD
MGDSASTIRPITTVLISRIDGWAELARDLPSSAEGRRAPVRESRKRVKQVRMSLPDNPHLSSFVAFLRLKNVSERTIEEYVKILRALFRQTGFDERGPEQLTTDQLRLYLASLKERGLAPKTISDHVIIIKRFFGFLLQEGRIAADPSRAIPYPKFRQRLPRVLSIPDLRRLFDHLDDSTTVRRRDQVFFQLAYAAGLRISETTHLRAQDINWE